MSLVKSWVWPDVSIRRKAQSVINEAFGAATVVAVLCLIFALMPTSDSNSSHRLVVLTARVVFGLLCIGIFLRSRIAAVSALVLFSVTIAFAMLTQGPRLLTVRAVILFAFLNGVRRTFAYHELPPKPLGLPSIQQSFQSGRPVPPSGDESSHRS